MMTQKLLAQSQGGAGGAPINQGGITNPALGDNLQNLSGAGFVQSGIGVAITMLFIVGFVVFVFMFLIGGIQWITSQGDKANVEAARNRIGHAIIGLFILFIIFAIITLISGLFGVNLINITIPTLGS